MGTVELAKRIKRVLKHPRKAQRFINLQLEILHGLCPVCAGKVREEGGLKDFNILCDDCKAFAKQYEDELNELLK